MGLAALALRARTCVWLVPERRRRARAAQTVARKPCVGVHGVRARDRVVRQRAARLVRGAPRPLPRAAASHIPLRYPAVELVAGLLFAACFWKFGLSGSAVVGAFFCLTLVAVSATDLEHRIIPNRIVVPAGLIVLVANTALHPSPRYAIGAVGASGFLLAAALAYPAGMGMGDVKLAFLMGAALGASVTVALFVGMLAALVPSIVLLARHGKAARKMGIPFGPFLALGSVVALFAGPWLLHAYASLAGL